MHPPERLERPQRVVGPTCRAMFLLCGALAVGALEAAEPATPGMAGESVEALAPDIDPLTLTPEMKAFVDARIGGRQTRRARLLSLQRAIFDPEEGLGIAYGSAATHTAAGTFETRSGNCLSFTLLFVSLARYVGLEAYFIEVDEVTGWSQRGEIGLSHWHMYVEVEVDSSKVPVDFLPWTERRYRSSQRISEARVRAHYHNNLGANFVAAGQPEVALSHFRRALVLDSSFNPARVNMAVALRRMDRDDEAEQLLLRVLRSESSNAVAAANLATLYLEGGRPGDAAKWLAQRDRFLNRNPFHHFRLGMRAFDRGDYKQARNHFKKAISRQPDEGVFFEQLAEAQIKLGATRKARSNLRRALDLTEIPERRRALEERLRVDDLEDSQGS